MISFPYTTTVNSEHETAQVAMDFARTLSGGEVVALNGQLGAGKTFFIKKMLTGFGVDNVSSPTFALVNQYSGRHNGKHYSISHFDFYRINDSEELYDIGFEEYITADNSVTLIEWAGLFPDVLPKHRIEILIEVNEDFSRTITFSRIG